MDDYKIIVEQEHQTVIAQFGDTYPAMKPKDWMHLIHSYITHEDIEDNSCLMAAEPLNKTKED